MVEVEVGLVSACAVWDGKCFGDLCSLHVPVVLDELFLGMCLDCGSETVPFGLCFMGLVLVSLQGF